MLNVFLFSQNLKIESLNWFTSLSHSDDENYFLTTQLLFSNETEYIKGLFPNCHFKTFADYLTDEEMESCDVNAFYEGIENQEYIKKIKRLKNKKVIQNFFEKYNVDNGFIISDDLGIDSEAWVSAGFRKLNGEYYYTKPKENVLKNVVKRIGPIKRVVKSFSRKVKNVKLESNQVKVAFFNGRKYVFIGSMNRIAYRLGIDFVESEEECEKLNEKQFETKECCTYMTTWHEHDKCRIPDDEAYCVRWAQDGYLPPNYSHKDYFFKPKNVVYYCWDKIGTLLFENQGLPFEMIPFRKKIFLPEPSFPKAIERVLVVASGSGDWTALKNRSDDDLLVEAFVEIARSYPEITFTYRCHPTWIHPDHVGVNSIERVKEYLKSTGLKNIRVSGNIPSANSDKGFVLSFSRTSLDEDLKDADVVFGEHSISMIDAAFRKIPFGSVNLTKRRNFFEGISNLGFPHLKSIEQIKEMIDHIENPDFQEKYLKAVENYNKMTDIDF